MIKIAVASGKGGTGKTTVSVGLARAFSLLGKSVALVDCDVEEPNCHVFFPESRAISRKDVISLVPHVEEDLCSGCRRCYEFCHFNAIVVFDKARILDEFCHRCGGCNLVCPKGAISEEEVRIGEILEWEVGERFRLREGRLTVGQANPSELIKETKDVSWGEVVVIDCPPGTGCSVMEAIEGVDLVVAVVEDTPFGVHDFEKFLLVTEKMALDKVVVWNRADISIGGITKVCADKGIDIVMSIPFMREFQESYARRKDIVSFSQRWRDEFLSLAKVLLNRIEENKRDAT